MDLFILTKNNVSEKQRYATIGTWIDYFEREEGVKLVDQTVRNRIEAIGLMGMNGLDNNGKLLRKASYKESDVRQACTDLLKGYPQANKEGFIMYEDQVYGSIKSLSRKLGISCKAIKRRLEGAKQAVQPIRARPFQGRECDFYPEDVIRELCSDILKELPRANKEGFLMHENKIYRTIKSITRKFGLSDNLVDNRLKQSKLPIKSIEGKIFGGQICDFYPEDDIRKLCYDPLQDLSRANKEGFIMHEDQVYGTIAGLSRGLRINANSIRNRLKKEQKQVKVIEGRLVGGLTCRFYPKNYIRELCTDLIAKNSNK